MLTLLFPKRQFRLSLWLLALVMLWGSTTKVHAMQNPSAPVACNWRELKQPAYLWPGDGAIYFSFACKNGSKVHLVVADLKNGFWAFKPGVSDTTAPTSETADKLNASAAVNGGFFNLSDGVSASYITINGKQVANPKANEALVKNTKLQPYLETVFNRSEIRFLEDRHGKPVIQIVPHNQAIGSEYKLIDALQAGPQLLPEPQAKQEAFLRIEPDGKAVDSISVDHDAARTAFGITNDGYGMLVTVTANEQDPSSSGVTIAELSHIMKELGCSQAINLDGGASSTMFVRYQGSDANVKPAGTVVSSKQPETRVKSILYLYHPEK
jgi:hypothetical protein